MSLRIQRSILLAQTAIFLGIGPAGFEVPACNLEIRKIRNYRAWLFQMREWNNVVACLRTDPPGFVSSQAVVQEFLGHGFESNKVIRLDGQFWNETVPREIKVGSFSE